MSFDVLWQKHLAAREAVNEDIQACNSSKKEFDKEERERLENKRRRSKSLVLGHPESITRIRCWMVDAHGIGSEFCSPEKTLGELVKAQGTEDRHSYMDGAGALAQSVKAAMLNHNYRLTDSGGGCGGWHLGCHCTSQEADQLILLLHDMFKKAIEVGVLKIDRHAWSLRLVGGGNSLSDVRWGYIAGVFDGEGRLSVENKKQNYRVTIAQKDEDTPQGGYAYTFEAEE